MHNKSLSLEKLLYGTEVRAWICLWFSKTKLKFTYRPLKTEYMMTKKCLHGRVSVMCENKHVSMSNCEEYESLNSLYSLLILMTQHVCMSND